MAEVKNTTTVVEPTALPAVRQRAELSLRGLQVQLRQAEILIDSGLLPKHITNPAAAVAIMQRGHELGLPPLEALTSLYVVHNKVSCDSKTMLALAWKSGVLERLTVKESENDHCTIVVKRKGGVDQEFTFRMSDAAALDLAGKEQYKKQPRVMLRWRAIAEALRVVCPDALAGLYTHEEMQLPVRVVGEEVELDSAAIVTGEQHDELRSGLDAAFDKSAEAGSGGAGSQSVETTGERGTAGASGQPVSPPPAHSAEPVCPKCGAAIVNQIGQTSKAGKKLPAFKCSAGRYNRTTKKVDGCDWTEWDERFFEKQAEGAASEKAGESSGTPAQPSAPPPSLPMDESQKRAIKDLCGRLGWNPTTAMKQLRPVMQGLELPNDLRKFSESQAAQLINALRAKVEERTPAAEDAPITLEQTKRISELRQRLAATRDLDLVGWSAILQKYDVESTGGLTQVQAAEVVATLEGMVQK